ncbi:hypothetical protein Nepgr_032647 [Nepenthes gracilis]|uniref:Uncharacterized protein n=1 Tax=Nepenthes gracilis TaxID=150966 RepID=A0AAD3TKD4_NEPGR|nr:hypothetical protein Nepgr_032647 [Nepenthes gracilis]
MTAVVGLQFFSAWVFSAVKVLGLVAALFEETSFCSLLVLSGYLASVFAGKLTWPLIKVDIKYESVKLELMLNIDDLCCPNLSFSPAMEILL